MTNSNNNNNINTSNNNKKINQNTCNISTENIISNNNEEQRYNFRDRKKVDKIINTSNSYHLTIKQATELLGNNPVDESINKELSILIEKDCFTPVKNANNNHIIPSSLFLTEKITNDNNGTHKSLKSRLTGGGHRQWFYQSDGFASTVFPMTYNCMIQIANQYNFDMEVWDFKSAFINSELPKEEETYMILNADITKRYINLKPEYKHLIRNDGSLLVKLNKAIYGLKEAAKLWFNNITNTFKSLGFIQSENDQCLFTKYNPITSTFINLCIHVDDVLVIANNTEDIIDLKNQLTKKYGELKTQSGNVLHYIGSVITRDRQNFTTLIDQKSLISNLLKQFNITETSNAPSNDSIYESSGELLSEDKLHKYRSFVMSTLYLSMTRPDIAFTSAYLATKSHCARESDYNNGIKLLQYLNKTINYSKIYKYDPNFNIINVWADASYGIHNDGRSHTGYTIKCGYLSSPLISKSVKQNIISTSSTESELVAVFTAIPDIRLLIGLFNDFYLPYTIQLGQDNASAISLIYSGTCTNNHKKRNMVIKINTISEFVKDNQIIVYNIPSQEMYVDGLTKPIPNWKLEEHNTHLIYKY